MSKTREKIAKVLAGVGNIGKNGQIQNYTYRSMDDILNAIHPLLKDNGIFIAPSEVEYQRENRMVSQSRVQTFTIVKVTYKVYSDEDDDVVTMQVVGEAADMGDKSVGKAMTYAFKVLLQQLFAICTNEKEDPDAFIPEETEVVVGSTEYQNIMIDIESAQTGERLIEIWNENKGLQEFVPFSSALSKRKVELGLEGK